MLVIDHDKKKLTVILSLRTLYTLHASCLFTVQGKMGNFNVADVVNITL